MEPNTTNNVVAIENVTFTDPDENIRKAINREERIFSCRLHISTHRHFCSVLADLPAHPQ